MKRPSMVPLATSILVCAFSVGDLFLHQPRQNAFVSAPAWLSPPDCAATVSALGLSISEDTNAIQLAQRGMRLSSPVIRWSARTEWRARMSAGVASFASWRHRRHWLVRIALHPSDLGHPATAASIETTLDYWLARRTPWTYSAL